MRTSQKTLLSAVGIVVFGLIGVAVLGRLSMPMAPATARGPFAESGPVTTRAMALRGFERLAVRGTWDVTLVQGEDWAVELSYPENFEAALEVEVRGDELVLDWDDRDLDLPPWRWFGSDERLSAEIVMPELSAVAMSGASHFEFSGFDGQRLALTVAGSAFVEGRDGRYEELALEVSGAGRVEMRDVVFRDALVNLSGASDVEIGMAGGVLEGNLSGVGNVRYSGEVAAERVNILGFGRVQQVD